ncbi:MAG: methyltransferase domain-containing protein [Desulfobacterales bacterium]|nr:methyltransferase domain-containing protein [Desulfobacterales bacterium]
MIRYEYMDESIREQDIHPDTVFEQEQVIARALVSKLEKTGKIANCPICNSQRNELLFKKWGLTYAICPQTWSVALSMPLEPDVLSEYFKTSDLAKLRASRAYQDQVTHNRKELWAHQIEWMAARICRYLGNDRYQVVDWGGKFIGWEAMLSNAGFVATLSVEAALPPIINNAEQNELADVLCLIDVLQRMREPVAEMQTIAERIKPGGLLIATCRSGPGFDILTLREASESIFPLDHIFLPSPQGLAKLLHKTGFEVLEITTPGQFDMQYIRNSRHAIPHDQYFQRYLIEQGDEPLFERIQAFLQRNNLSSHLRCVAKRLEGR